MDMRGFRWSGIRGLVAIGLVCLVSAPASTTLGHETDNFHLPLDAELADVGDFLEAVHTLALEEAVAKVNAGIERALKSKNPVARAKRLARWHDPEALARAFVGRFSAAVAETRMVEHALRGSWAQQTYPGQKTAHHAMWMNFSAHIPPDPRMLVMLSQCATLKAFGVYFGADKLTHLHHLGWRYYKRYRSELRAGLSQDEAYRKVLEHFTGGSFFGEANMFGTIGTGVYSNADMAANHVGFKFLLNFTEKVTLQGQEREPLLVRHGVFWGLNRHVRPRSGWLGPFFSDHWNEALNPSLYDVTMRPGIRRVLRSRAEPIVRFYTQKDGRPADPAYYERLTCELSTYYDEPYGHSGKIEKLMTIGNTCLPALRRSNR
jgi:hypothetical protein